MELEKKIYYSYVLFISSKGLTAGQSFFEGTKDNRIDRLGFLNDSGFIKIFFLKLEDLVAFSKFEVYF